MSLGSKFHNNLDENWTLSRKQLEPYRKFRNEAIRHHVGHRFTDNGAEFPVVNPLMSQFVQTYHRKLTIHNPKALITTDRRSLKPAAASLGMAVDRCAKNIRLQHTISKAVLDALFSIGIVKTGIKIIDEEAEMYGEQFAMTSPFCDTISLDDFSMDMFARDLEEVQFIGHDYWMMFDAVRESGLFEKTRGLVPDDTRPAHNETGEETAKSISAGNNPYVEPTRQMIKLRDIYIPSENVIITKDIKSGKVLREIEWTGPEGSTGPFMLLGFGPVPETPMHIGPAGRIMPLHKSVNQMLNKQIRRALNGKVVGVAKGDKSLADKIIRAKDGSAIFDESNGTFEEFKYGGADPQLHAYTMFLDNLFSEQAGNLRLITGSGAQSETLGQDQLLQGSASSLLQDMRLTLTEFVADIYRHLAYYKLKDPFTDEVVVKTIPGKKLRIEENFRPTEEERDILAYNYDITPYSDLPHTPSERLSFTLQIWNTVVLPALPLIQQAGGTVKIDSLLQMISDLSGINEVGNLVSFPAQDMLAMMQQPQMGGARVLQAPNTTRTQIRENRPNQKVESDRQIMSMMNQGEAAS